MGKVPMELPDPTLIELPCERTTDRAGDQAGAFSKLACVSDRAGNFDELA
jgi:hypothetical protein